MGGRDCLLLERSLYAVCFFANFGGDGCAGTDTLGTDVVSGTTLGSVSGWFVTTVDCVFNYYGNVG